MARGSAGSGETGLEALEKDEGGKRDGWMELGAMKGVCDGYAGRPSLGMSR